MTIYGDALAADWASWSWSATIDFNGTSPVRVGTRAINVTYQAWGGLSLRKGTAQSTSGYTALKFWVHGGTGAAKSLRVYTQTADTGGESTSVVVSAPANTWTEITVPLELARQPGVDQATQHPGEQRGHAADDDVRRDPPDAVAGRSGCRTSSRASASLTHEAVGVLGCYPCQSIAPGSDRRTTAAFAQAMEFRFVRSQ